MLWLEIRIPQGPPRTNQLSVLVTLIVVSVVDGALFPAFFRLVLETLDSMVFADTFFDADGMVADYGKEPKSPLQVGESERQAQAID